MSERRFFEGTVEERTEEGIIFGYAAIFNSDSQILHARGVGDFIETIDQRAFDSVIDDPNLLILANHDHSFILGRTGAGTAEVGVDERGLWYKVKPPKSRADIYESVQRRDMAGSSFSFDAGEEEWSVTDTGMPKRHIRSFKKMYDVGPVSIPAYLDTTTATRNYENFLKEKEERERANNLGLYKLKLRMYENSIII